MNAIERSTTKAANAIGGKTARACENCLVKRARWFCSADDAFLCQACDASVHSANQLASKHERFSIETTSSYKIDHHNNVVNNQDPSSSVPSWHQGFTKRARTPRLPKSGTSGPRSLQPSIENPNHHVVPEINSHKEWPFHPYNYDHNEEQSVPVFPPSFEDDFDCVKLLGDDDHHHHGLDIGNGLFSACNVDFSVENMLEEGNSSCGIGRFGLGLESSAIEAKEEDEESDEVQAAIASCHFDPQMDMEFDWDFVSNGTNPTRGEGIKSEKANLDEARKVPCHGNNNNTNAMQLKLDYEAVIESWAIKDHSPWIDGVRPHHVINIGDFTVACMRGTVGLRSGAEREARVMRYKEKRRTRLFSKKIRYQVRKLNAQKRPRIKGRFVKRSAILATNTIPGISFPYK